MRLVTGFYFFRRRQKLFVRLDALGQEFAVSEQGVGCGWGGGVPGRFFVCDVDGFEWDAMFFCGFLYFWYPIVCVRALVGVVKNEAILGHLGLLGAFLEFWWLGIGYKG